MKMLNLNNSIRNIFGSPVYYFEKCGSTMDEGRLFAHAGAAHGTVVTADFQQAGRGRIQGRKWESEPKSNLLCTIILHYDSFADIPQGLTLRAGLAVSEALETLWPELAENVKIKWPNDIMLDNKKLCGILTESDGNYVFIGIGVNVFQRGFTSAPDAVSIEGALQKKAASMRISAAADPRFLLLETILRFLCAGLETNAAWNEAVSERLYMKGRRVSFAEGAAESGAVLTGELLGIDTDGALLLACGGGAEPRRCVAGELHFGSADA
ncbi:MAG: biotin--[acetyl-CoA-carboxylase] ligase [Spirochaetaceae bacterium]|jgi:BirA family biotin operon repressor/biotin-[acetyl-CoA-carboxylase] ligase|nr:biotin--[acetyl-CoA-carboxylase] ligase [Spirochaetaceae bacterium]